MSTITDSLNCVFCLKKGIAGPHNHMIRDVNRKGKPIVCPELLNTECNYCHVKGHTPIYCPVLKLKKSKEKEQKSSINSKYYNENKRACLLTYDSELLSKKKKLII